MLSGLMQPGVAAQLMGQQAQQGLQQAPGLGQGIGGGSTPTGQQVRKRAAAGGSGVGPLALLRTAHCPCLCFHPCLWPLVSGKRCPLRFSFCPSPQQVLAQQQQGGLGMAGQQGQPQGLGGLQQQAGMQGAYITADGMASLASTLGEWALLVCTDGASLSLFAVAWRWLAWGSAWLPMVPW